MTFSIELKPAQEAGTCQNCSEQINEHGIIPGAMVYEIQLKKITIRLCPMCAWHVQGHLHAKIAAQP